MNQWHGTTETIFEWSTVSWWSVLESVFNYTSSLFRRSFNGKVRQFPSIFIKYWKYFEILHVRMSSNELWWGRINHDSMWSEICSNEMRTPSVNRAEQKDASVPNQFDDFWTSSRNKKSETDSIYFRERTEWELAIMPASLNVISVYYARKWIFKCQRGVEGPEAIAYPITVQKNPIIG